MLDTSPWRPRLAPGQAPAHERLERALAEDILTGAVPAGARLPAHRELAAALGLSVATVTRAYGELRRRGLAQGEHGRGTFAVGARAEPAAEPARTDLSINFPPATVARTRLGPLLAELVATFDPGLLSIYLPPAGLPAHRAAVAAHLARSRGIAVEASGLLLTNGAHHAIFVALAACPPGPVAVEALAYPLALATFRQAGRRVIGLALDAEGLAPEALEAALRGPDPPRVLYLVPTLHNPTGATMSEARRARIAALARAHDLLIIEDDVYAMLAPEAPPAFARLAPERTLHAGSFSKSVSPGLRLGYLVAPAPLLGACAGWLQATHPAANPLGGWLAHRALESGLVEDIAAAIRTETARRSAAVRAVLGHAALPAAETCLHVWLPMPTARAEDIMRRAARHDIVLAAPQAFQAEPEAAQSGLRLCLGNADAGQLTAAVGILAGLMREDGMAALDERALI